MAVIEFGKEGVWTETSTTQDAYISFKTALNGTAAEKMRIDSAGNVGIGNGSPLASLDVRDGHIVVGYSTNTSQEYILMQGYGYHIGSTIYGNVSIRSDYNSASNGGSLEFYTAPTATNTAKRMSISTGGLVSILDNNLEVYRAEAGNVQTTIKNTGTGGAVMFINAQGAGDPSLLFRIGDTTTDWVMGIDNSDADKFKICNNATLGSSDAIVIDTAENIEMPQGALLIGSGNAIIRLIGDASSSYIYTGNGAGFSIYTGSGSAAGASRGLSVTSSQNVEVPNGNITASGDVKSRSHKSIEFSLADEGIGTHPVPDFGVIIFTAGTGGECAIFVYSTTALTTKKLMTTNDVIFSFGNSTNPDVDGDWNFWISGANEIKVKNRLGGSTYYSFSVVAAQDI